MEVIKKYFPEMDEKQEDCFREMMALYQDWNAKINVISRKDMEHFYLHHVLHSLSIAKRVTFTPGSRILDIGTGGGFPGIPLAVMFPQVDFFLIDAVGKKIKVVQEVSDALGLKNVKSAHLRAEDVHDLFEVIVSRAVTALPKFLSISRKNLKKSSVNGASGIYYLKGSDYLEELSATKIKFDAVPVSRYFEEDYFIEKFIVHIF